MLETLAAVQSLGEQNSKRFHATFPPSVALLIAFLQLLVLAGFVS